MTNPSSVVWGLIASANLAVISCVDVRSLSLSRLSVSHTCVPVPGEAQQLTKEEVRHHSLMPHTLTCAVSGSDRLYFFAGDSTQPTIVEHFSGPQEFYNKPRAFISECLCDSAEPWPELPAQVFLA